MRIIGVTHNQKYGENLSKVLWEPTYERKKKTAMYRFMKQQGFKNYDDLYQWSINKRSLFWEELAKFCDVRFLKKAKFYPGRWGIYGTRSLV